ncbi:hypothetical protein [Thermoleptolyngbya sp. M55_K2018_002]|uniref:hypothetical protein n=1 Tax=Thermoleptolyngbya sp. M55_K2018_002 TaxID=2747808 RepID=UPI0019E76F02|nr:hypothetical protein [Thermoleptolyngbya sp. M55_K2018_002]HIK42165.1 hypothetical protein [Thermoleptolyngbya sp. M55_K2018_002]
MPAIRYNQPNSFTIDYVAASGAIARLTLIGGVNLGVTDEQWRAIALHPVVKALLQDGTIEPLISAPESEGELAGFNVIEDKRTGQPMPIVEAVQSGIAPARNEAIAPPGEDSPSLSRGIANPSLDAEPVKKIRRKT